MKVFVSTDHATVYPVGAASVAVAEDENEARKLIDAALAKKGLDPKKKPYTVREILPLTAEVLVDGDY